MSAASRFETARIKLSVAGVPDSEKQFSLLADARSIVWETLQCELDPEDVIIPADGGFVIVLCPQPNSDLAARTASLRHSLDAGLHVRPGMDAIHVDVLQEIMSPIRLASLLHGGGIAPLIPDKTDSADVAWLPMWDVRREALTAYWLTPVSMVNDISFPAYPTSWMESRVHTDLDFLAFDTANLVRMVDEAEHCLTAGLHCLVGYSVHATTLENRERRQSFLARLYETPSQLRRHIIGRIAEIEPGTPAATIAEWVRMLRPISSDITLQLHESEPALDSLAMTGASTASFTLSSRQHVDQAKDYYARHIQRWAARLRRQRVLFRLDNIEDSGLVSLALAGGAEFLTSESCWPRVPGPAGVRKFPRSQLGQVA